MHHSYHQTHANIIINYYSAIYKKYTSLRHEKCVLFLYKPLFNYYTLL